MSIYNNTQLKKYRKKLRNNLTPAEATLWKYLKKSQLNRRKFRRQSSIGKYIVDFYCPEEKLVIELDGDIHQYDKINNIDRIRSDFLKSKGIKILRFENSMIFENLEGVLRIIETNFKQ